MKSSRLHFIFVFLLLVLPSAKAQFTLGLRPVAPGTGELRFTLDPGYYYCLESSGDILRAALPRRVGGCSGTGF